MSRYFRWYEAMGMEDMRVGETLDRRQRSQTAESTLRISGEVQIYMDLKNKFAYARKVLPFGNFACADLDTKGPGASDYRPSRPLRTRDRP